MGSGGQAIPFSIADRSSLTIPGASVFSRFGAMAFR
jgi:hypothetical protein